MSLTESRSDIVGASLPSRNIRPIDIHFEDLCCTVTELKFGIWSTGKSFLIHFIACICNIGESLFLGFLFFSDELRETYLKYVYLEGLF